MEFTPAVLYRSPHTLYAAFSLSDCQEATYNIYLQSRVRVLIVTCHCFIVEIR